MSITVTATYEASTSDSITGHFWYATGDVQLGDLIIFVGVADPGWDWTASFTGGSGLQSQPTLLDKYETNRMDVGVWWKYAEQYDVDTGLYYLRSGGTADSQTGTIVLRGTHDTDPIGGFARDQAPNDGSSYTTATAPSLSVKAGSHVLATVAGICEASSNWRFQALSTQAGDVALVDIGAAYTPQSYDYARVLVNGWPSLSTGATAARTAAVDGTAVMGAWAGYQIEVLPPNQPPNAPTLTSMHDGSVIDRAATNRASHSFDDPDAGDSQSAFDHRYRIVGSTTWTETYHPTPNQYVDLAAGTLEAGDYERQVRTYDALGVEGPWSSSGYFTAADAPASPTITDPINNETISAEARDVSWSAPAQDAYQLQVLDGGLVEHDTGTVTTTQRTAYAVPYPTNNVTRTTRVRVRDGGLWSDWYSVDNPVSYTKPAAPAVALAASGTAIVVQVTNPPPAVGEPAVTHNRVYVDDGLAEGETLRVAELPANGTWTYRTPRAGVHYEGLVRVVAVGDNGTTAEGVA